MPFSHKEALRESKPNTIRTEDTLTSFLETIVRQTSTCRCNLQTRTMAMTAEKIDPCRLLTRYWEAFRAAVFSDHPLSGANAEWEMELLPGLCDPKKLGNDVGS